jgi:hypothetical protein
MKLEPGRHKASSSATVGRGLTRLGFAVTFAIADHLLAIVEPSLQRVAMGGDALHQPILVISGLGADERAVAVFGILS